MVVDKAVRKGFRVCVCTVARLHGVDWKNDRDLSRQDVLALVFSFSFSLPTRKGLLELGVSPRSEVVCHQT